MNHPSKMEYGDVLGGRYVIERKIGEGGMSCVYLAGDLKLPGQKWAVKESVSELGMHRTVEDEASLLIKLSHPRLPRIVDFFKPDPDGYTYLVMDYIEGMTLERYYRTSRSKIGADFIVRLADQLLEVLSYLHEHDPQVIFRDLKPSNIMLTEQLEVRLIDFGIARSFKQESGEDTVKLGTVGFAAPEQYGGRQSDARSDLYGLGALLLYLCTGGNFTEWIPGVERHIRGDLPRGLVPIIRKLLQYAPEDRYPSAKEARQAVDKAARPALPASSASRSMMAGTLVAAALGASAGVGTTHSCIALAYFLAKHYRRVAVAEMGSQSSAFSRIQEIAEGGRASAGSGRKFEIDGIHFWRQTGRAEVISLLGGSYDAVVLDLGVYRNSERLEEFLRADVPLIVGSGAEWRQHELLALSRLLADHHQPHRLYALPLAGPDALERVRKLLDTDKVYTLPLQLDPFELTSPSEQAFRHMFRHIIAEPEPRKRRFRFLRQ
ncbi:serine/threonine-protein kinase [Paenibacillus cisolokensis]|uniref:serine/threonine protein kinase n=1 Tax=Paenibacillus cisolokensis TaxID=1658519 RepID=UPI003D2A8C1B